LKEESEDETGEPEKLSPYSELPQTMQEKNQNVC